MTQRPSNDCLLFPKTEIPFDRISAEHVVPSIRYLVQEANQALDAIASTSGEPTFDDTLMAMERATEQLEYAMGVVEHLESVASEPALRDAYNEVLPEVSSFWSNLPLRQGLWERLSRLERGNEFHTIDPVQRRFATKTLDDFRRHGAELNASGKARLEALDQELSRLTTRFGQNVLDATNAFEHVVTDPSALEGLPASALAQARESARVKGKRGFRLTLQSPSVSSVLMHAKDRGLRRMIWTRFNRRATEGELDNRPLLTRILELRRQKANLLGFAHFADLVTEDRMAKTARQALEFVETLGERTRAAFERETEELIEFRRQLEGPGVDELAPWDVSYYAEKQRRALYDFDEEELKPYFSAKRVLQGAFAIAERLYGLRIEELPGAPTWHPDVNVYRILEGNRPLGVFYTDLHPRESKRDGAWMHGLLTAAPPEPHVALLCANASPPAEGVPSLLNHRDVETVFHEFGHLLHHCLSKVPIRSLAGTRVAQDFVELPSQIMENWCSEKAALDLFAAHYETHEPIPEYLVSRLLEARKFRAASAQMRQLGFAATDLALHMDYSPEQHGDVNAYANSILGRYAPTRLTREHALIASFGHLFAHPVGYAAGYYSYKWAEVLDADAFTRFKREGILSAEVGRAFRDGVLSRGDSEEPMSQFSAFVGRAPRLEPMLERQGLL